MTMHLARAASLSLALLAFGLAGCSGSSGSSGSNGSDDDTTAATGSSASTPVLRGDFLRATSSSGDIQEILFADETHYALLPVGCDPSTGCAQLGTYATDGDTLTLTDAKTGAETTLPLAVLQAGSASTGGSKNRLTAPDDLVSSGGSSLVNGSSGTGGLVSTSGQPLLTGGTGCPAGQSCASLIQAGNNTLVADNDSDDKPTTDDGSGPTAQDPCRLNALTGFCDE